MFLKPSDPRRSFSVPVNINLQGARRRNTREVYQPVKHQDQAWRRGMDARGGTAQERVKSLPSVGEDRALLLGFAMMAFSVLMFFVAALTTVKPYISSHWEVESSCVVSHTELLADWVGCRGVSSVPCLRVLVNVSGCEHSLLLHYDEEPVHLGLECFYIPKCRMDVAELQQEVLQVKRSLDKQLGGGAGGGPPLPCLTDPGGGKRPSSDAILTRKYTLARALSAALLWPGLMLAGGALLVGLVKLTQWLAHLCSELDSGGPEGRGGASRCSTQGKLYRLLSGNTPSQECA